MRALVTNGTGRLAYVGALALLVFLLVVLIAVAPRLAGQGPWDVIVVGSEPEGVAAAVAAAESGARTLLVTQDRRIGGLFVLGEMNVLDLRTQPFDYQLGLFGRWWELVGRRHSFDVERAERAFEELLAEARVTVLRGAGTVAPVLAEGAVVGVSADGEELAAKSVIDATADMYLAAAAGAPHTLGFESVGLDARMVDTLVFRIDGVDWRALRLGIRERNPGYAAEDDWVAWGHFGGYPAAYRAQEEGLRLRGLNLGRQEDGSLLVNALLVHGGDLHDQGRVAEAMARASAEAARIVDYLAKDLPGFEDARLAGVAERLYVRESRHLQAECMLSVDDVLDNRVGPLDIAAGGYPLDVQPLTPHDSGYVFGVPDIYGVPLCVTVPLEVDGLWVVGKAAGFDPIAASSARVVPLGMAVAEATGVAAALAARGGTAPRALVSDETALREVRRRLEVRGAVLPVAADRDPVGPFEHEHYGAYRFLLRYGLAVGGYANDPGLGDPVQALSYAYLLSNVGARVLGDPELGDRLLAEFPRLEGPLTAEVAEAITRAAGRQCRREPTRPSEALLAGAGPLTRGRAFELARWLAEACGS